MPAGRKTIAKNIGYLLALTALVFSAFLLWAKNQNEKKIEIEISGKNDLINNDDSLKKNQAKDSNEQQKEDTEILPEPSENALAEKLPSKILIEVPFTSQAPFGKWDAYHEEACEEASLVMIQYYLQGKKLTPQIAEKEIQALIAYQFKKRNDYKDTTAEETKKLGEEYYGIKNLRLVYDFSIDDLKKYLALKKPIIVPAAGRLLGNPNFTAPGPLYHNLVLIGYENQMIITNDPGTRKGQNYRYNIKTLYEAIHDFPGSPEEIKKGRKAMIVLAEP